MDNVREDLEERGIRLSIAHGQTRKHAVCTYAGIEMSGVCTYAGIEMSGVCTYAGIEKSGEA